MPLYRSATATIILLTAFCLKAETAEPVSFGNFEQWVTRHIHESRALGGQTRTVYAIGPQSEIDGNKPYVPQGGSPWATSNVYARVMGIVKASNAVSPAPGLAGGQCCHMTTILEKCRVLGLFNLEVLVSGSIYLGWNDEPISSTANPYGKMEMGIPFTRRPRALRVDYRVEVPQGAVRLRASGVSKKELPGQDNAEIYLLLQRRWEDADGNIYARRVGTARQRYDKSTDGWITDADIPVIYGDASQSADYKPWMGLIPEKSSYYARNSRGKLVPVKEVGWDTPDATPTHMLLMASAGCGTAYEGTPGMSLWIDNLRLVYP